MTARAKPLYLADLRADAVQILAAIDRLKVAPVEERLAALTRFRRSVGDKAMSDALACCLFPEKEASS